VEFRPIDKILRLLSKDKVPPSILSQVLAQLDHQLLVPQAKLEVAHPTSAPNSQPFWTTKLQVAKSRRKKLWIFLGRQITTKFCISLRFPWTIWVWVLARTKVPFMETSNSRCHKNSYRRMRLYQSTWKVRIIRVLVRPSLINSRGKPNSKPA